MKYMILLCWVLISGCTSVASSISSNSSGVLPYKNSTYMISTDNAIPSAAQKNAFDEAISFCKKKGKEINVVSSLGERTERFTLYFDCR